MNILPHEPFRFDYIIWVTTLPNYWNIFSLTPIHDKRVAKDLTRANHHNSTMVILGSIVSFNHANWYKHIVPLLIAQDYFVSDLNLLMDELLSNNIGVSVLNIGATLRC